MAILHHSRIYTGHNGISGDSSFLPGTYVPDHEVSPRLQWLAKNPAGRANLLRQVPQGQLIPLE